MLTYVFSLDSTKCNMIVKAHNTQNSCIECINCIELILRPDSNVNLKPKITIQYKNCIDHKLKYKTVILNTQVPKIVKLTNYKKGTIEIKIDDPTGYIPEVCPITDDNIGGDTVCSFTNSSSYKKPIDINITVNKCIPECSENCYALRRA